MMQMVAAHNSATSGSTMDSISPLALRHNLMSKWYIVGIAFSIEYYP